MGDYVPLLVRSLFGGFVSFSFTGYANKRMCVNL